MIDTKRATVAATIQPDARITVAGLISTPVLVERVELQEDSRVELEVWVNGLNARRVTLTMHGAHPVTVHVRGDGL